MWYSCAEHLAYSSIQARYNETRGNKQRVQQWGQALHRAAKIQAASSCTSSSVRGASMLYHCTKARYVPKGTVQCSAQVVPVHYMGLKGFPVLGSLDSVRYKTTTLLTPSPACDAASIAQMIPPPVNHKDTVATRQLVSSQEPIFGKGLQECRAQFPCKVALWRR